MSEPDTAPQPEERPGMESRTPGDASSPDPRVLGGTWDRFYEYCFAIINQCPGVRKLSSADREDCIQEVMVELVRRFGEGQPGENPEGLTGWIRVVTRNKAADIVRRHYRKPEVGFDDGSGEAVMAPGEEVKAGLGLGDRVSLVWEALALLEEEVSMTSSIAFFLRTIEGWSVTDIAELMEMTPEQVRARLHRVRTRLDQILKSKGDRGVRPKKP
jgi:RNA polymerase sigma factor (sigma-70 family)